MNNTSFKDLILKYLIEEIIKEKKEIHLINDLQVKQDDAIMDES